MRMKQRLGKLKRKAIEYRKERKSINPHRSFKLTAPRKGVMKPLVLESWRLFLTTHKFLWAHRKFSAKMIVGYAFIGYFLIGGVSQFDYVIFKDVASELFIGNLQAFEVAGALFGATLSGALVPDIEQTQQFLAAVMAIMFWLILVWSFRMLSAQKTFKIRDALYIAPAPFVSTLAILFIMAVQLLPGTLGLFAYNAAVNGQWLQGGAEAMLFGVAAFLLCVLSLYWFVVSVIALPVVSLPGTYPLNALRQASKLVMGRRWSIVLRIVIAAILLLALWALILFPVFLLDNWLRLDWLPLIPITLQLLSVFSLFWVSAYTYRLYRSLL